MSDSNKKSKFERALEAIKHVIDFATAEDVLETGRKIWQEIKSSIRGRTILWKTTNM